MNELEELSELLDRLDVDPEFVKDAIRSYINYRTQGETPKMSKVLTLEDWSVL